MSIECGDPVWRSNADPSGVTIPNPTSQGTIRLNHLLGGFS